MWLSAELPGSEGALHASADDFAVAEILPYAPCGEGEHLFIEIEKRDLTTPEAARRIAEAAGLQSHAVAYAGLKDKDAIARQWFSIPLALRSQLPDLSRAESAELRVLGHCRHRHKLKRGHTRANRFSIAVREVPPGGIDRAKKILELLSKTGVPNAFGPQRFGRDAGNVSSALAILRGDETPPKDKRIRTLLMSSVQSEIFNRVLALRIARGLFTSALLGDVMQKHDTGGLFEVADPLAEQPRVDALQISPTAALPGKKYRRASGPAQAIEDEALHTLELTASELAKLGDGTRRVLRYPLDPEAKIDAIDDDAYRISFTLPSGAYATVLLAELVKPPRGALLRS